MIKKRAQQTDRLATKLLRGKAVHKIVWFAKGELLLQFADGSALFVDSIHDRIELSFTDGPQLPVKSKTRTSTKKRS